MDDINNKNDNIIMIQAVTLWVAKHGMKPMPENVVEWALLQIHADCAIEYSEQDTQDELNLLDSYKEEGYNGEDSENSQQLALNLMETKYNGLE
tara:strand:- start:2382 stop:2663 length:282 start_codon:yes stop_codon:yes gene_type:complete